MFFLNIIKYSHKSFDDIDLWIKDLKTNSSPDIKIFLIGNKADLEEQRVINKEQAEKCKEDYDLDYFIETSAKTGMNAREIFIQAAKILYENYFLYRNEKKTKDADNVNSNNTQLKEIKETKKKNKCC